MGLKLTPETQQRVSGTGDLKKSFTPILEIFRQATGRVKGGVLCRRSEPLTRSGACRIGLERGEDLGHCGMSVCERNRRPIGQSTMWHELVVVSLPPGQRFHRVLK